MTKEKVQEDKKMPEKKIRAGAISATVWKNTGTNKEGKDFEFPSVSIQRSYTDKGGIWQSTNSLRTNDLPRAALVLNKAYEYLAMQEKESAEN